MFPGRLLTQHWQISQKWYPCRLGSLPLPICSYMSKSCRGEMKQGGLCSGELCSGELYRGKCEAGETVHRRNFSTNQAAPGNHGSRNDRAED